jgi:hypothetical protein
MPTATFRRYDYRRHLPHFQQDDRPVCVTFRAKAGFSLAPDARTLTLQHGLHDHGKTIHLHAVVIMPDHVHLLFTALRDADGWPFALPEILRATKGTSARNINCSAEGAVQCGRRVLRPRHEGQLGPAGDGGIYTSKSGKKRFGTEAGRLPVGCGLSRANRALNVARALLPRTLTTSKPGRNRTLSTKNNARL